MSEKKNKKEVKNEAAGNQDKFEIIFSWKTVDFIKNPQNKFFLSVAVIASMGMIIWGISTKSPTVIFTFILIAIVSIIVLNEESREINVRIDENGINFNNKHFDFKDFVSFKISEMHGLPTLSLNRKEKYLPPRMIYIEKEPADDLRDFLEIYLPEEEQ